LKHPNRNRYIPQSSRAQIQKINRAQQARCRVGDQYLTTVPCGHHPGGAVEHRSEIICVAKLGLPGRNAHAHRQLQSQLGVNSRVDCGPRRAERSDHAITGVTEQETVVRFDRGVKHSVVRGQGRPHRVRIGFPPTSRSLDVGEKERHDARRRVPRGHSQRMSHNAPVQRRNRDELSRLTSPELSATIRARVDAAMADFGRPHGYELPGVSLLAALGAPNVTA
jgi:hypothetical protein